MSMNNRNTMLSRLDDIERLVRLSSMQYGEAEEAYKGAERLVQKKMMTNADAPGYRHLCMMHDKAKQQADDLYKEAGETTARIQWAKARFKADFPDQRIM